MKCSLPIGLGPGRWLGVHAHHGCLASYGRHLPEAFMAPLPHATATPTTPALPIVAISTPGPASTAGQDRTTASTGKAHISASAGRPSPMSCFCRKWLVGSKVLVKAAPAVLFGQRRLSSSVGSSASPLRQANLLVRLSRCSLNQVAAPTAPSRQQPEVRTVGCLLQTAPIRIPCVRLRGHERRASQRSLSKKGPLRPSGRGRSRPAGWSGCGAASSRRRPRACGRR